MSDFNIEFEENDQQITLEFESGVGGAVSSVNGMTGVVVLTASDVGALPTSTPIPTVDNTLTTAGAAADAKKVGDEISTVKDGLTALNEDLQQSGMGADVTVLVTSYAGKRWGYPSYSTEPPSLIDSSYTTAWEFDAVEGQTYVLQGLAVGTNNACAVIFYNADSTLVIGTINDATQDTGHKLSIVIPDGCSKVRYTSSINSTWDAPPVRQYAIAPLIYQPEIINIKSDISDLDAEIDAINDVLPSYYNDDDYFDNKIATINSNAPLNGVQFAFITDMHFRSNQLNSLPLLKQLIKKTAINTVISGGDFVDAYGTEADLNYCVDIATKYARELFPYWVGMRGNHDLTIKASADTNAGITLDDAYTYNTIVREGAPWRYEIPVPETSFLNGSFGIYKNYNWVLTNEHAKVKIIGYCSFNKTVSGEVPWGVTGYITNTYCKYLGQMLLNCDGYTVILMSHNSLVPDLEGGSNNNDNKVVKAFVERGVFSSGAVTIDFTNSTGVLACVICGHGHVDESEVVDGYLTIQTTCDATFNNDPNTTRTAGTITEQAFDVFSIDTDNRTIKATRIGGGVDRNFTY